MEEKLPNGWILPAIAFGFILLVSFLFVAGSPTRTTQTAITNKEAVPIPDKKSVFLSLSPEKLDLKVGVKTTIPINIQSLNEVSAVEIHLTFDPKVASIKDIAPLEFFDSPEILKKDIDNEKGEVIFILGSRPARAGSGQLAQVSLVAGKAGSTNLKFSSSSQAAITGQNTNALGKTSGTIIYVK